MHKRLSLPFSKALTSSKVFYHALRSAYMSQNSFDIREYSLITFFFFLVNKSRGCIMYKVLYVSPEGIHETEY